eukprot:gene9369-23887_t
MAFTTLACRIFYVYYGVMAYMFMFQTETQIKMFEYADNGIAANALALNMARWCGAGFASLSLVFMAAAQLPFKSQKKILQYSFGQELNIGRYLCILFALLSIVPCYVGTSAEKGKTQ